MKAHSLAVALCCVLALAACKGSTGPMGPAGPGGPGTRLVLDDTTDEFGEAIVSLPTEAGTLASPPAISCYISEIGDLWFLVSLDSTDGGVFTSCIFGEDVDGTLLVGIVGAPADWLFRVVVVY